MTPLLSQAACDCDALLSSAFGGGGGLWKAGKLAYTSLCSRATSGTLAGKLFSTTIRHSFFCVARMTRSLFSETPEVHKKH